MWNETKSMKIAKLERKRLRMDRNQSLHYRDYHHLEISPETRKQEKLQGNQAFAFPMPGYRNNTQN